MADKFRNLHAVDFNSTTDFTPHFTGDAENARYEKRHQSAGVEIARPEKRAKVKNYGNNKTHSHTGNILMANLFTSR